MHIPTHAELLNGIADFLGRHPALSERQIGVAVTNEPGLIGSIRKGRSPSLKTLRALVDFMASHDANLPASQADASSAVVSGASATKSAENICGAAA